MKLLSYAQIPKETPFLHIGYVSAPEPDKRVRVGGITVIGTLLILFLLTKNQKNKLLFFMLSLISLVLFIIIDSNYKIPSYHEKHNITLRSMKSIAFKIYQYETEHKKQIQDIHEVITDEELTDQWGRPILCMFDEGYLLSAGGDGKIAKIKDSDWYDDIVCTFREFNPPESAVFTDTNKNQRIDCGDTLEVFFEKPFPDEVLKTGKNPIMANCIEIVGIQNEKGYAKSLHLFEETVDVIENVMVNGIEKGHCLIKIEFEQDDEDIQNYEKIFLAHHEIERFSDYHFVAGGCSKRIPLIIQGCKQ